MSFPFKLPARYEAKQTRREGGQAYLHVARDKFLDRDVAIKIMKWQAHDSILQNEIAVISSIRSRHVAELYDTVKSRGSGWLGLVQEYVSGPSLDEEGCITKENFLLTLWQIAAGLADIHNTELIHRDIKPWNIRFDSEGVIKILDFGLSTEVNHAVTMAGRGTRGFLAPEFYNTAPIQVTQAADVYAFGVTAWYLSEDGLLPPYLLRVPPSINISSIKFPNTKVNLSPDLNALLVSTLSPDPSMRPRIDEVRDRLARELLFGKHRAILTFEDKQRELNRPGSRVRFKSAADVIAVEYDGFVFKVAEIEGNVFINNNRVEVGMFLPQSCVLTLGPRSQEWGRRFVAVDMSHPGVVV